MVFILFSAAFVVITVFYLTIAIRILFLGKPTILRSSWVVTFLGLLVIPFTYQVRTYFKGDAPFSWIGLVGPLLYVALLVFYLLLLKGETFYGINETDFQTSVHQALRDAKLEFVNKVSKIELVGTNMVLRYSYNPFSGSGILRFTKVKTPEEIQIAKTVEQSFKAYFTKTKVVTRKGVGVLYLIFSLVLIFLTDQLVSILFRPH